MLALVKSRQVERILVKDLSVWEETILKQVDLLTLNFPAFVNKN